MPEKKPSSPVEEEYITIRAKGEQLEKLAALGVLSEAQLEAGRQAGGLEVRLPAGQVAEFQNRQALEELAARLEAGGWSRPARLFLTAGRPLSFFGSQLLLMVQPVSKVALGQSDLVGRWQALLEDRRNVDYLVNCLENLEQGRQVAPAKTRSKERS